MRRAQKKKAGGRRAASRHPTSRNRETAALHALGILPAKEARSFEAHVASGCKACAADAAAFVETLSELGRASEVAPPPGLRSRLLAAAAGAARSGPGRGAPGRDDKQVWRRWKGDAGARARGGLHIIRAAEGDWERTAVPGVSVKPLSVDPDRRYVTMLVRMEPGSSYPIHRHAGAEECLVLQGDLEVGGETLHAGDYQHADEGSRHAVQSTEKGCLLLIVSSQEDELL
jgi:quercetin dioxygenase-like cupin family protein